MPAHARACCVWGVPTGLHPQQTDKSGTAQPLKQFVSKHVYTSICSGGAISSPPPPSPRCPGLCMNRTSKRGVVSCRQGGNHIFQTVGLPAGTAAEVQALHPLPLPSYAASSSYTLARPLLRCDAAPLITCSANHTSIPPCCAPFSPRASSP